MLSDDIPFIRPVIDYNADIERQRDTIFQLIQADPERVAIDFAKHFRAAVALMRPKTEVTFKEKGDGNDVAVDVLLAATAL